MEELRWILLDAQRGILYDDPEGTVTMARLGELETRARLAIRALSEGDRAEAARLIGRETEDLYARKAVA